MSKELFGMLQRGYFPKELPPAFNTYSFALMSDDLKGHIEAGWGDVIAEPIQCSIPKNELGRRFIQVLHPLPFFFLAKYLTENYATLLRVCSKSTLSCSKPIRSSRLTQRYLIPRSKSVATFKEELLIKSLDKYVELKVDLSNYYPSIYTHIIPWAIVGRNVAKEIWRSEKKKIKPGCSVEEKEAYDMSNQIDILIEHCQEKQTHGIPIGPDTSFLVAETILSSLDEAIRAKVGGICGVRYYDDYYLYFDTTEQAEAVLKIMIDTFKEFGLEVNLSKVEINHLPISVVDRYAVVLSPLEFKSDKKAHMLQVFFELMWSLVRECPGKGQTILKYGLSTLERNLPPLAKSEQSILFILLFKTAVLQPSVTPEILNVVDKIEAVPDPVIMKRMSDAVFRRHISLENHIEILWGLWVCKKYNIDIDDSVIVELLKLNHPLCSLMVLDYMNSIRREKLLTPSIKSEVSRIHSSLSARSLYDQNWILLYEGGRRGWVGEKHLIEEDSFFNYLLDKEVSFYDENNDADYSSASYILKLPFKVPGHIVNEAKREQITLIESIKKRVIEEQSAEMDEWEVFEESDMEEVKQKIEDNNINDRLFEELLHLVFQGDEIDSQRIIEEYVEILRDVKDY